MSVGGLGGDAERTNFFVLVLGQLVVHFGIPPESELGFPRALARAGRCLQSCHSEWEVPKGACVAGSGVRCSGLPAET